MAIFTFDEKSKNVTRDGEVIFNVDNFVNNTSANKLCDIMNQYALDSKASGYNEYMAEAYENNTYLLDAEYFNLEEMLYTTDADKILNADDSDKHVDDEDYEFHDANFSKGYFQFNEKDFKDIVKNQIIDFLNFHNETDSCLQEEFLDFLDRLIPEVVEKDVIENQLTDTDGIFDYSEFKNSDALIRNSETADDFINALKRLNHNSNQTEWAHVEIVSDSKELAKSLNQELHDNEFSNFSLSFTHEDPALKEHPKLICETSISKCCLSDHVNRNYPSFMVDIPYPQSEDKQNSSQIIDFSELKNYWSSSLFSKTQSFCRNFFEKKFNVDYCQNFSFKEFKEKLLEKQKLRKRLDELNDQKSVNKTIYHK